MNEHMPASSRNMYIPAVSILRATLRYSANKLPVATMNTPDQICGEARRIGYTGKQAHDLALYRLKVRPGKGASTITLPGLYILDDGLFQDYEQWQQQGNG
ncbi:MAG TPA: hypothetical protein VL461_00585 [Dictyobacter sp.]|nr:hypothetical protein [Dictyobacter sp.]